MDDFQGLLYILFGIIWIISRVMKAKKKRHQPPTLDSKPNYEPPQKEVSFEDLLKEFTEGGREEPAENYEDLRQPELQELEVVEDWSGSDKEATSVYEQSIKEAQNARVDMVDFGHNHHLQRFEVFEEEEEDPFLQELRADLQNSDSLRKAVIYKEILDRKHF